MIVALAALNALWFPFKTSPPTFSKLEPGEEIQIVLIEDGCFNHDEYTFWFRKSPRLQCKISIGNWDKRAHPDWIETGGPKTLILTPEIQSGLDTMLAFYRGGTMGGCTTISKVWIKLFDNAARLISFEEHTDRHCLWTEVGLFHPKGGLKNAYPDLMRIVWLDDLIYRSEKLPKLRDEKYVRIQ